MLLCATDRGKRVLDRLIELAPDAHLSVCSFREELLEPPFLNEIENRTRQAGGDFFEVRQIGSVAMREFWRTAEPDLMFSVNWRYKVPFAVFSRPKRGSIVFHDSLLPKYRGFSPTVWAMINGESQTGLTLFQMSEGIDEGDIIEQVTIPIGDNEQIASVTQRVTEVCLEMLSRNLRPVLDGTAGRWPQDHSQATFACKRVAADNLIDWSSSTQEIYNLIRACGKPYPGAWTIHGGQTVVIWTAEKPLRQRQFVGRIPGRIVHVCKNQHVVILTGDGELELKTVQLADHQPCCAADLFNDLSFTLGS